MATLYILVLGIVYIYVQQDHTNFPFITHVDMDRASTHESKQRRISFSSIDHSLA